MLLERLASPAATTLRKRYRIEKMNRQRGVSLIELLISSLIVVMVLVVGANAWVYGMQLSVAQYKTSVASQIARADVERAKIVGFANLPLGTIAGNSLSATHNGTVEYFDKNGVALGNSTGAYLTLQRKIVDAPITVSGTTYTLSSVSKRTITTTVKDTSNNTVVLVLGTVLAKDGL
jgi:Tfp pilus assembly protein PilV